jgi:hypothetical protein
MDQTLLRSIRMATLDLRCDLAAQRVIAALERCAGLSGTNHWETQPRDDHGRWTDGLGAGEADAAPVVPVGSFSSLAVANMLVDAVLEKNLLFVRGVQAGVLRSATIGAEFPFVTGREAFREDWAQPARIRETRGVRVLVLRDESSLKGFRIHTAYPYTPE